MYVRASHIDLSLKVAEQANLYVVEPQQASSPLAWIGGHGTEPNEQNTQQSPGFGRKTAWQLPHS